ncbi:MAG: pcaH [Rickettsiaceae bacterium]|nr:pcaH [Rickettsiaceae bacterium]
MLRKSARHQLITESRLKLFAILIFTLFFTSAFGADKTDNELFNPRPVTPTRLFSADLSMPEKFNSTNNLVQKTGSFYGAFGELLFVQGTITDSFGLPIEGAIVDIWQTNSAGKYQTLLDDSSDLKDKNFNMSGRSITDNLGNYYFITIVPGFYLNRAPHINFNIYHPKFGKLETEMYFENHPRNQLDYQYLSYSEDERKLLTAKVRLTNIFDAKSTKIASFNIVMKGVHQYKSFGNN